MIHADYPGTRAYDPITAHAIHDDGMRGNAASPVGPGAARHAWSLLAILIVTAALLPSAASAQVETTFDTDLEGWAVYGDNVFYWVAGEGNPGGCLRVDDDAIGLYSVATAPPAYLGDWSTLSPADSLAYDAIYEAASSTTPSPPAIFRIEGPGGAASYTTTSFGRDVWNHFSIPIDPAAWTMETGTWASLITDVTACELAAEMIFGDEVVRLDNVRLGGTPGVPAQLAEVEDFEDGIIGWTEIGTTISPDPMDGSPGACIVVDEQRNGGAVVLPSWFGGPWDAYVDDGVISFSWFPPDPIHPGGEIRLEVLGPGGTARHTISTDPYVGANHLWHPIVIPITESAFDVTAGTWEGVVAHVQKVRISCDVTAGNDTFRLDTVYRGGAAGAPATELPIVIQEPDDYALCDYWTFRNASALARNPADGVLYTLVNEPPADGGGVYAVNGPAAGFRLHAYDRPAGLVFTDDGDGFVSENYAGRVFRFVGADSSMTWISSFLSGDDDPAGLTIAPTGFDGGAVSAGDLIVVDHGNGGTDAFWAASPDVPDQAQQLVADPGAADWYDVTTDGASLWACDSYNDGVLTIAAPDGSTTSLVLSQTLSDPRAIAYDTGEDVLYLTTNSPPIGLYRVDPVTGDVTLVANGFGASGYGNLEIDPVGRRLWVTDSDNSRVYEICLPAAAAVPDAARPGFGLAIGPSPVRASTVVKLELDTRSVVRLHVFDASGRRVRRLADGVRDAGTLRIAWDARDDRGHRVEPGIFFVRAESDGATRSAKLTVLR